VRRPIPIIALCTTIAIGTGCKSEEAACPGCAGCCLGGVCRPGNTSALCGVTGNTCQACAAGQGCVVGVCTPCDATTCAQGCCTSDGRCVSVIDQTMVTCGGGGSQCQSCGTGQCINGQCQQVQCDASSCADGCCSSQGACLSYYQQDSTACGTGATVCTSCAGAECVAGQCQGAACGPGNCATGCCSSEGQCLTGTQQDKTKCGKAGNPCGPCDVGDCVSGQCQSVGCNPTNCQGCCASAGQCLALNQQSPVSCGAGGDACAPCPSEQPCENGQCKPTCTAATCAQGCCNPQQQCLPFAQQSTGSCGINAAPCQLCNGQDICTNGQCLKAWKVLVLSAAVTDRPGGWDASGSISGPQPDPFVVVQVNATGKTGKSKYIDDTFTPVFNEQVLVETEAMLNFGVTCQVKEDDGFLPAEMMGTCAVPSIPLAALQSGKMTIVPCNGYATQVVLGFLP